MITNTLAKYLIALAFFILMFYGAFVFRHVFYTPQIVLDQPLYIETSEPTLLLSGTVDNITSLSINNKPVLFEQSGRFSQLRTLGDGISNIVITGKDKFSREESLILTIDKESSLEFLPPPEEMSIETTETIVE